jgi:hypothetical protein
MLFMLRNPPIYEKNKKSLRSNFCRFKVGSNKNEAVLLDGKFLPIFAADL